MAGRTRIRTDLALEATERFQEENVEVRGVEIREKYDEEKEVRGVEIREKEYIFMGKQGKID